MRTYARCMGNRRATTRVMGILAALVLALGLWACAGSNNDQPAQEEPVEQDASKKAEDKASKKEEQKTDVDEPDEVVLAGKVSKAEPKVVATIKPEVSGVVNEVKVMDGQAVKEGDLLYTVAVSTTTTNDDAVVAAQNRLANAQAEYNAAEANYNSVMESYNWAVNNYEQAHAEWETRHDFWLMQMYAYDQAVADAEWRRDNNPDGYDENGVPYANINYEWPGEEPVEPVLAGEVYTARADAEARLIAAENELGAAQAARASAQPTTSTSTQIHELKAPAAGTVDALKLKKDMKLSAQDDTALLKLVSAADTKVEATVEKGSGNDLTLGGTIKVVVPDAKNLELEAKVTSVSPKKVELVLVKDDEHVQDGMRVEARIPIEKKKDADDKKDKDDKESKDDKKTKDDKADKKTSAKVDVSHVDYDVAAMSDDEAFQFMHDFGNRTSDEHAKDFGKVMHIKGQVSRYVKKEDDQEFVSYRVGIKGEGGTIWGVNFYVEGWEPDDYPEHKSIVEVTGMYGMVDGYGNDAGRTLLCNAEDVKVVE